MSIQPFIPAEFSVVYKLVVGQDWPQSDEDALRRCAQAWTDALSALVDVDQHGAVAATDVHYSVQSVSTDEFDRYWQQFTVGDDSAVGQLAQQCQMLAGELLGFAEQVEFTKISIDIQIIILVIQLAYDLFLAPLTGGLSMTEALASMFFTRIVVREIISRLLGAVMLAVLPDLITQGIMVREGHRSRIDVGEVAQAAQMGLVGGAIGMGVGRVLGGRLGGGIGTGAAGLVRAGLTGGITNVATNMAVSTLDGVEQQAFDPNARAVQRYGYADQKSQQNPWDAFLNGMFTGMLFHQVHESRQQPAVLFTTDQGTFSGVSTGDNRFTLFPETLPDGTPHPDAGRMRLATLDGGVLTMHGVPAGDLGTAVPVDLRVTSDATTLYTTFDGTGQQTVTRVEHVSDGREFTFTRDGQDWTVPRGALVTHDPVAGTYQISHTADAVTTYHASPDGHTVVEVGRTERTADGLTYRVGDGTVTADRFHAALADAARPAPTVPDQTAVTVPGGTAGSAPAPDGQLTSSAADHQAATAAARAGAAGTGPVDGVTVTGSVDGVANRAHLFQALGVPPAEPGAVTGDHPDRYGPERHEPGQEQDPAQRHRPGPDLPPGPHEPATDPVALPDRYQDLQDQVVRTPAGMAGYRSDDVQMFRAASAIVADPTAFVVDLHGDASNVHIGGRDLSATELADLIRLSGWDGRQSVVLLSCGTGGGGHPFAAALARELGVEVIAPTDPVVQRPQDGVVEIALRHWNGDLGALVEAPQGRGRWLSFRPDAAEPTEVPARPDGMPVTDPAHPPTGRAHAATGTGPADAARAHLTGPDLVVRGDQPPVRSRDDFASRLATRLGMDANRALRRIATEIIGQVNAVPALDERQGGGMGRGRLPDGDRRMMRSPTVEVALRAYNADIDMLIKDESLRQYLALPIERGEREQILVGDLLIVDDHVLPLRDTVREHDQQTLAQQMKAAMSPEEFAAIEDRISKGLITPISLPKDLVVAIHSTPYRSYPKVVDVLVTRAHGFGFTDAEVARAMHDVMIGRMGAIDGLAARIPDAKAAEGFRRLVADVAHLAVHVEGSRHFSALLTNVMNLKVAARGGMTIAEAVLDVNSMHHKGAVGAAQGLDDLLDRHGVQPPTGKPGERWDATLFEIAGDERISLAAYLRLALDPAGGVPVGVDPLVDQVRAMAAAGQVDAAYQLLSTGDNMVRFMRALLVDVTDYANTEPSHAGPAGRGPTP